MGGCRGPPQLGSPPKPAQLLTAAPVLDSVQAPATPSGRRVTSNSVLGGLEQEEQAPSAEPSEEMGASAAQWGP